MVPADILHNLNTPVMIYIFNDDKDLLRGLRNAFRDSCHPIGLGVSPDDLHERNCMTYRNDNSRSMLHILLKL
jgi:hypothetical protein